MFELVFRVCYGLFAWPQRTPTPEKEYMWVCPECGNGNVFSATSNTYSVLETLKQIHQAGSHGRS